MSLVEEQTFTHLWWSSPADRHVLASAQHVLNDWAAAARPTASHLAFGARSCLRRGGECSWVGGVALQHAAAALHAPSLSHTGEAFGYARRSPRLEQLAYLAAHATPAPLELRVVALWRRAAAAAAAAAAARRGLWREGGAEARVKGLAAEVVGGGQEAYDQLVRLPRESVRFVDVDAMIASPKAYAAELAHFLCADPANTTEALLAAVAASRRLVEAEKAVLTPRRRAWVEAAVAEAEAAVEAKRGEEAWTKAVPALLRRGAPARLVPPDGAVAREGKGWGEAVAKGEEEEEAAPEGEVFITHVLNPFRASEREHVVAQRLTLASIAAAAAAALAEGLEVEVLAAVLPHDEGVTREICAAADTTGAPCCGAIREVLLNASASLSAALPHIKHPLELPLLRDILRAGHRHGRGKYLVYSNIDIALQKPCYIEAAKLLAEQPLVPLSLVREEFEFTPSTFTLADAAQRRGHGLPHPGHDLWVFPREWVPDLYLGPVALGVSLVAAALNQALLGRSRCRLTLLSRHLTFHVVEGESVVKHKYLQRARRDPLFREVYAAWNCVAVKQQMAAMVRPNSGQRDFKKCWFAQQVGKSLMAYKCASYVGQLPEAQQRAWAAANNRNGTEKM